MKSKKKMKRKRMKKGMLLAELYRLFTVRRLMTGIFLVAIIAVISVSDLISIDSINWPAELKQSICDQLQITLVFDRYKSLYVIAASICTVTTFPSDIKNHVLPYIRQRTDFDSMMNARLFAIAAYIIVTMIGGFLLAGIVLNPFMTIETRGSSLYGIFQPLMNSKAAWIYLVLMSFNLAMSIIPVCYLAAAVAILKPDEYVAVGAGFFVFYLLFYFTEALPWMFSYSSLTSEPGRSSVGEVIYHVVFFTICSLATAKCVKVVMQKRFLNGMD